MSELANNQLVAIPTVKPLASVPPPMTVADALKQIPKRWRNAELAASDSIGRALPVKRIALHRDDNGRQVVVIYEERLNK